MAGEDEDDDGFSFPTTTSPPARFIGSPRLWRSSSEDHRKKINFLSYIKKKDGDHGSNENMDVIWEDLNYEEEVCRGGRRSNGGVAGGFSREVPEWGRKYGGVGVAGGGGGGKRPSMVVLVYVLKKLLLLHHTSRLWTVKK